MTETEWLGIGSILVGLLAIVLGILIRQGRVRAFYWFIPFNYYRSTVYGAIPFGIAAILLGVSFLFFLNKPLFDTVWIILIRSALIFFFLVYLFMWLFEPRFAKPDWINWVEDFHSDILPELRREIGRMKGSERKRIINDQAALEEWIAEFRRRR